jgi:hypothetical protein
MQTANAQDFHSCLQIQYFSNYNRKSNPKTVMCLSNAPVIHQPWISSVCSFHCLRGKPIQEICLSTTTAGTAVAQLIGALRHNTKGSEFDPQDSPWKF